MLLLVEKGQSAKGLLFQSPGRSRLVMCCVCVCALFVFCTLSNMGLVVVGFESQTLKGAVLGTVFLFG